MVTSTELPRVAFLPVLSTYSWPHPTTPGMEPRLEGDRPISHDLLGHGQLFPEGWPGQWSHQGKSPPHLAAPRPVHWGSSWNCWPERQGILAIGLGAHSLTEGPLPWPPPQASRAPPAPGRIQGRPTGGRLRERNTHFWSDSGPHFSFCNFSAFSNFSYTDMDFPCHWNRERQQGESGVPLGIRGSHRPWAERRVALAPG